MLAAIQKLSVGAAGLAVAALAMLTAPAPSPAATVQVTTALPVWDNETALVFTAAPDEDNRVAVRIAGRADSYYTLEVLDGGAPLTAGAGCTGGAAPGGGAFCRLHETVAHEVCIRGCAPPQWGENWRPSMRDPIWEIQQRVPGLGVLLVQGGVQDSR